MKTWPRFVSTGLCWSAILMAGSGCARFHAEPLSAVQTLSAFEARSLGRPELKAFLETNLQRKLSDWPLKEWNLDLLTLAALYFHPDLEIARAQWKAAKGAIVTAGERPNPSLGFTPEYKASASSALSPWLYGFTFDIPVETMGKRRKRITQAKHHAENLRLNLAVTAWQIRSRLRTALVHYEAAKRNGEILRQKVQLQQSYLRFLKASQNDGGVSLPDRLQSQIALNQNQLALSDAERQIDETKIQLAESIGIPVSSLNLVVLASNLNLNAEFSETRIREVALTKRPDLLGALAEYETSQSALQLEIARQYPDIHLGPGYTWDQGQNKWTAGVTVTLPALNHNQGPIAEALARREEARARFVALQEKIIFESERAFAIYKNALEKWETARKLLVAQKHQNHLTKSLLKTGETSRPSSLNAQLALQAAELSYTEASANLHLAAGLIEDAVMTPFVSQGNES